MKGTVAVCLKETIVKRAGASGWQAVLAGAGFPPETIFTMGEDVEDARITALMGAACTVLGLSQQAMFDAFAEYWMVEYGPRIYIAFYDGKRNAREFLETMDNVHIVVMNAMTHAKPPRFRCEWVADDTMIMHYASHRGLIDLMVSFIKGVAKYYREDLSVTKLGPDRVQIVFPA
jgi:hypothetical protein